MWNGASRLRDSIRCVLHAEYYWLRSFDIIINWIDIMAFYCDGTLYQYLSNPRPQGALNIGWLDNNHQFATGIIDVCLVNNLKSFLGHRVNRTRGYHYCDFCGVNSISTTVFNNNLIKLGSGELRIVSWSSGAIYAAPDMIIHYIESHHYLPCDDFISAIQHDLNYHFKEYVDLIGPPDILY